MTQISKEAAIKWLEDAAKYFENRSTGDEDMVHWANVANAETAIRIRNLIATTHHQERPTS